MKRIFGYQSGMKKNLGVIPGEFSFQEQILGKK